MKNDVTSSSGKKSMNTRAGFKDHIMVQIQLPRDEWNADFKDYVEEKRKKAIKMLSDDSPEVLDDASREKTYRNYLKDLCIEDDAEYLKDKCVIDLGCGDGEFVLECLKRGQVKSAYGLDLEIRKELCAGEYKENFIQGDYTERLPFACADIILSDGGASTLTFEDDGAQDLEKLLRNCIEILNDGGEVRIAPINFFYHSEIKFIGVDESMKRLMSVLERLSGEGLIGYRFEPIDIHVGGKDFQDVWLWQALIIKKIKK